MSSCISIDPGTGWTGVGAFDALSKRLLAAKRIKGAGFRGSMWNLVDLANDVLSFASQFAPVSQVVFEWPQVYRHAGGKDRNDLLPLAALEGAILAKLTPVLTEDCDVQLFLPHDWKGSKKANPTARMVIDALDPTEWSAVQDLKQFMDALRSAETHGLDVDHPAHNTLDAVGVGLKKLGRLGRKRVIRR
jgi:hypothetical protein